SSPRIVLIVPQNETSQNAAVYQTFAESVPSSAWYSAWAPGAQVGAARAGATIGGDPIYAGTMMGESAGSAYVSSALSYADPSLGPDGNTIYLVMLPLGATLDYQFTGVGGHHYAYGSYGDGFALAMGDPGGSTYDSLTEVAAHEIAEAATDTAASGWNITTPGGAAPWSNTPFAIWEGMNEYGGYIEDGDLCQGSTWYEGSSAYQRIYDNDAAAQGGDPCVPALFVPYF